MINNQLIIAKRYAQAFLNVFPLTFTDIEKITEAIDFLKQHAQIITFLKIPLLDPQVKFEALKESLIRRFDLPESLELLVQSLIRKKRAELLLQVLEHITMHYHELHNIKLFTVSSSAELTDAQKKIIEHYLVDETGAKIVTHYTMDKKLIAGVRMQNEELQWEHSLAQQLKKIRASLIG